MMDIIKIAAQRLGGIDKLAKSLNVTRQIIYKWSKIPSERVIEIERLTGLSRQILRPDLYPSNNNFTTREFRDALGHFATGITIVTTLGKQNKPEGLTVNSFTALSLSPPQVLWCLGKQSPSRKSFEASSHFSINVLNKDQRHISNQFATSTDNKFQGIKWDKGLGGAPTLLDCIATFECSNIQHHQGGDHIIFIGQVERVSTNSGIPLLYNYGKYGIPTRHPDEQGDKKLIDDFDELLFWY